LSAVFRHKREEVTGENGMMRSFMVFISHHFLFRWSGRISWVGEYGRYEEEERCLQGCDGEI
jgi:hypothetical protein